MKFIFFLSVFFLSLKKNITKIYYYVLLVNFTDYLQNYPTEFIYALQGRPYRGDSIVLPLEEPGVPIENPPGDQIPSHSKITDQTWTRFGEKPRR